MKSGNELLSMILKHRNAVPELEDLTHAIVKEFGGPEAFAIEIHRQYTAADRTPMARVKILDSIIRLINLTNENRKPSPIDTMTLEEMEAAISEAVQNANAKTEEGKAG